MKWEQEVNIGRAIARRAGQIALETRARGLAPESKSDQSPVTEADRASESFIAAALKEAFPEDGLLGEEGTEKASMSGRRWIIDPIDGTRDFIRGNPAWAVLLGLEVENEVAAGFAYFPELDVMFSASKGGGAFREAGTSNGKATRLQASTISRDQRKGNLTARIDPRT